MPFEQDAAAVGKAADDLIAFYLSEINLANSDNAALREQIATLTGENAGLLAANVAYEEDLRACRARVRRLLARIEELENPPATTLFAGKPEPATEAEYAAAEVRAGVPWPVHNHYATTWDQAVTLVNACKGQVCRITVAEVHAPIETVRAAVSQWVDKPIIWGRKHEPEDDIEDGKFTLDRFRRSQADAATVRDELNPGRQHKIVFGLCLMGPWTWDTRNPDDYYLPGVHEYVGTDPYPAFMLSGGWADYDVRQFDVSPERMLGPQTAWAAERGVSMAVMEWGLSAPDRYPGERAAYIRAFNEYCRENGYLWVLYWDHGACRLLTDDEFAAAGGA